ncbi:SDR family NAD(P)-dependent oxidoreductase [Conexibacter sp. CPCC 206217]|uniref:SDR family NAD(P)-dependent oxidoreductase n=1 Tax=Conexibacter sp. CPCC 206217 TaxID=3064574 RepID=UPI00271A7A4D|nr:SDR family NAD(P)-dependent oxidoreductase [Conexibacter sp. CPCC 206217]MDO8213059.1 SDR family NAD(P)-dependent oxidoreductase [Conexibacter sp. CPCC 206217]
METNRPDQPVALVTGANKGIGKAIAQGLARTGMTVLLGSRDQARGAAAAAELTADARGATADDDSRGAAHRTAGDVAVVPLQLDVTDQHSVDAAAAFVAERFGRLDVLVNNAGTAVRTSAADATADDFRVVYETNVFGVVAVTHALLPLLLAARAPRIVNVSSLRGSLGDEGAFVGRPSMPYSSSKTALNAITVHYARDLASTAIKVNAAAPGHVATDFNGFRGVRTPEQGARIAIRLATLPDDGPTGGFFDDDGPVTW